MANLPVQYSGVVVDGLQTPALVTSYLSLPDTATLAQADAALGVWAQAVDGVLSAAFSQVYAVMTPTLPGGLKSATGATWAASRVQETGIINFSATGTTRRYGQALPGFDMSLIVNGKVDIANAAIQALVDLLTNPTGFFTNTEQQSLEAALDALLGFRKRTFSRQRSTELFA